MSFLPERTKGPCYRAKEIWFEEDSINVLLSDAREICVPLDYYPTLLNAAKEQREDFELFGNGRALYFESIDFYLSINSLVLGLKEFDHKGYSEVA